MLAASSVIFAVTPLPTAMRFVVVVPVMVTSPDMVNTLFAYTQFVPLVVPLSPTSMVEAEPASNTTSITIPTVTAISGNLTPSAGT